MKISARNQLKGKVRSVQLGGIMAEVEVDVAQLATGDAITVIIKSTEVMIGK